MGGGVPEALQLGHFLAVIQSFAFVFHKFQKSLTADGRRWTQILSAAEPPL
jgi:hypothetical protein